MSFLTDSYIWYSSCVACRFSLHDVCKANAISLALTSLNNGIECQGYVSAWDTSCWHSEGEWRKSNIHIRFCHEGNDADAIDATFTISAGYFFSMTRHLSDLEQVKYGSATRSDLHGSRNEHGRIDLVFKPHSAHGRMVTICLLFDDHVDTDELLVGHHIVNHSQQHGNLDAAAFAASRKS